jgi:hypothetical protein
MRRRVEVVAELAPAGRSVGGVAVVWRLGKNAR